MRWIITACIRLYRMYISPLLPRTCRFYPTCSLYSLQVIEKYGIIRGVRLSLIRIARCHPWNPGGFDPVP